MKGIYEAADYLSKAIQADKKLLVIADYDCDGATACTVAVQGLRMLGAHVDYFVPNRFNTGYGLSPEVVDLALQHPNGKPDILITVDNGIASVSGVTYAKQHGIDVLITDHHLPGDETPDAAVIVNPNQRGCQFESKYLAGVGVIFYTLSVLRTHLKQQGIDVSQARLETLLDLVALGTIADVVPLDQNNRILVTQGIQCIQKGLACEGIKALCEISKTDPSTLSSMDLGFRIGPRINAAGRLEDMKIGIQCLLSEDPETAHQWAKKLDELNQQRKEIQNDMNDQALDMLDNFNPTTGYGISVFNQDWHQGVIGIVASKLKEKFYRPIIAFAQDENPDILKGSGRSIKNIHLRDVLDLVSKRAPHIIIKFGGHAMAAGLSIHAQYFDEFQDAFNRAVQTMSQSSDFEPVIEVDGSLATEYMTLETIDILNQQIWGSGFPAPLFYDSFHIIHQRILKDRHLKMRLEKDGEQFDAIWFGQNELLPEHISIAYELTKNTWMEQSSVQLLVRHADALS